MPTISEAPQGLIEIVEYRHPDALWIGYEAHAEDTYRVWVLDADYCYYPWLACRSLDQRWTLSPLDNTTIMESSGQQRL